MIKEIENKRYIENTLRNINRNKILDKERYKFENEKIKMELVCHNGGGCTPL